MIGSGKEYAGLQGVIGGHYARPAGEPEAVADAIYWHYHPRFAGDELPRTAAGTLLSLADKLDHVAGAFAAGKAPSGSQDPYGVRRAANGAVRILIEQELRADLAVGGRRGAGAVRRRGRGDAPRRSPPSGATACAARSRSAACATTRARRRSRRGHRRRRAGPAGPTPATRWRAAG